MAAPVVARQRGSPQAFGVYAFVGVSYAVSPIFPRLVEWSPAMAARCNRVLLFILFSLALSLAHHLAPNAAAQEFRVETDIYIGEAAEAASHTVTLFEKSAVYEFVESPKQIIVYRAGGEKEGGQFVLLDAETQRRTDVDVDRVEKLMDKLNRWAAEQKEPLLKFSAKPNFEETFDAASGTLTLSSPAWTYRVATVDAEDKAGLTRFQDFMDRYAALSSMVYNSPPPGPRLALNAALVKYGVVPVEIHRTTGGDGKNAVRATHLFSWRLSREDRARLDEAQADIANFQKVDNEKFIAARNAKEKTVVRGQSK
jgi:hypothetical protein